VVARTRAFMQSIGKLPVVCGVAPGFIVPRLQALVMNEAARMVDRSSSVSVVMADQRVSPFTM
jgi:3-hydroxybutyryl-CoA dehydrogenase